MSRRKVSRKRVYNKDEQEECERTARGKKVNRRKVSRESEFTVEAGKEEE